MHRAWLAMRRFPHGTDGRILLVSVARQRLYLLDAHGCMDSYPVSTSRYGVGSLEGSLRTPAGAHRIVAKIGAGAPAGRIFRGRRDTGMQARIITGPGAAGEDAVTSRILQLEGLDGGINRGAGIDTLERYIYIHGTPEEGRIGTPASIGCVRMTNRDVIELFDRVEEGDLVLIL